MILVLDNRDSFVFNIARHLELLGAACEVRRSDRIDADAVAALAPEAILVSPGPCGPQEAGASMDIVRRFSGRVPILGVCLGHQVVGEVFGAAVGRAGEPMHGRASALTHSGRDLFEGLPAHPEVGRYHSLIVRETARSRDALLVDALSERGEIMALRHRSHPTFGVQFHPESVLTPDGPAILANFLRLARAFRAADGADP